MKHALRLANIGFAVVAAVACREDAVNPVWQAMCEAYCAVRRSTHSISIGGS